MSDYEKDDELRRKYGEVMDSIADDIRQINVNKSEKIVLDEKADDISENTGDILSGFESAGGSDAIENSDVKHDYSDNKFLESISRIDFDNPDEVLRSIDSGNDEFKNLSDFNEPDFDAPHYSVPNLDNNVSGVLESNDAFDIPEDYPDTLSCDECVDLLYDYLSNSTDDVENMSIKAHLRNCEMCRVELDDIRDMIGVMSSSPRLTPPADLISSIHSELASAAPEVKYEYEVIKASGVLGAGPIDKLTAAFETARYKVDHFIRHANWRILAPAALSAVLVVGVASSGLYQVMKSSDEVYDFSDNVAIESAKATAKPSASGLDEYIGGRASESSPRTTSAPRASSVPGNSTSPRTTARPSAGSSSGLNIGSSTPSSSSSNKSTSSSTSGSGSTNKNTTKSNSNSGSSNKSNTSSSTNKNNTSSSSNKNNTAAATPAPKAYVTPKIILPDITSAMTQGTRSGQDNNLVIPENPAPEKFEYTPSDDSGSQEEANQPQTQNESNDTNIPNTPAAVTSGGGGGGSAAESTVTPEPTENPKPTPEATPGASAPVATPSITAEPKLGRNSKGETKAFADKSENMDDASVVSCEIKDKAVYDVLMSSALANCSKIDENGEVTLYFTGSEYIAFTDFLKANGLEYTLVVLGNNDDVKVLVTGVNVTE